MSFDQLNLSAPILQAINEQGYTKPTPVQEQAIPVILNGQDILGIAQTGSGLYPPKEARCDSATSAWLCLASL